MPGKKPHWVYDEADMDRAVEDVQENGLFQNKAAQKWGVLRTTLSDRLRGQGAAGD